MLIRPIFAALCLFVSVGASGDTITRSPQENDRQFAAGYAPDEASAVVHVASARVWGFERPVVAAFYEHPVIYADKNKNYGNDPNEKEVLGILFLPTSSTEYRQLEIDGYGPEGATAQINSVFFSNTDLQSDKRLFVMVSWHTNAGVLYRTYIYEKPQLPPTAERLSFLERLSQQFAMECDHCPYGDHPNSPAKYKTAADVKAELRRQMK